MELPPLIRAAVDNALEGVPLADLRAAAERLSTRYRSETRDGRAHISDDLSARAYLAVRMPATYAAIRASIDAVAELRPDFSPKSLLDAGAGPGTALFAARDRWPGLSEATLIESSPSIRRWGEALLSTIDLARVDWRASDLASSAQPQECRDLVMLAYVLDEISPAGIAPLVDRLWQATGDTIIVIEPGTPAGWSRILTVRDRLIAAGAHLVAPCPHALACPLQSPDWCHFSRRVARSRMHRRIKSADVPWEDEKYVYIAASRHPAHPVAARVIAPVQVRGGTVALKLCEATGVSRRQTLSKRDGEAFRQARRLAWGDCVGEHATFPADSAV
ncbi:small ribosomal subunit Rsm22 family protein [Pseudorhodoplanes sp.]|uniref:small ribosomal subunit Rsm22 family protein n=1 Tax=Pseudorhodoplanes sp. TaxID=1934341 RepID=UPI002BF30DC3|nr:small ribosomal subunit Rsm22 family protein [Pseudorhodoplanes sp.]HWV53122.1 small ribosomal subunit Rsm22 family protein [Pseudorhodoplanes sp.]